MGQASGYTAANFVAKPGFFLTVKKAIERQGQCVVSETFPPETPVEALIFHSLDSSNFLCSLAPGHLTIVSTSSQLGFSSLSSLLM